ncbi:MAG: hypothetical protein HC844_19705 [Tabrizicola sp.]|nr:hypothetical protein [Tabrizicola sp.]
MWVDPNLNDFYGRVARIEKAHAKGYGFEAAGTMSRSATYGRKRRSFKFMKPLLLALAVGAVLKGTIHYYVGSQTYQTRVDALALGDGFDPAGAWLMQADPVSLWISTKLQEIVPR